MGGLGASLLDCHGTASAAAAAFKAENREMGTKPHIRYVTASLKVNSLRPTPIDVELEIRGVIVAIKSRKVTIDLSLSANGKVTLSNMKEQLLAKVVSRVLIKMHIMQKLTIRSRYYLLN
jgi:hypothetical protein